MGPVSTDLTTATPGRDGARRDPAGVVLITCQRCGTVSEWGPYCPTDGAYLEIFGVPPWQPGGPPDPNAPADPSADVIAPGAKVDMDGDGREDDLPPIRPEMAGPTHPHSQAIGDAQRQVEAQEAAARPPVEPTSGSVATAQTPPPAAVAPQIDPLPSLADRQIQRNLPWGLRWTRACTEDCCTPKPHWWQLRKAVCCWSLTRWPLPPLPEPTIPRDIPETGVRAAVPVFEPMAELPQRVVPPTRATVALGADTESTGDLVCTRCLAKNEEGQAFCRECGAVLPGAILAPNQEPVPTPGRDPNHPRGKKRTSDPKKPPHKHDYVAWAVTAGVIVLIAAIAFAIWGPYNSTILRFLRLGYQNVVEFINPYAGIQVQVTSVTATSSLPGVLPGALIDGQSTVFWASAPSEDFGSGTMLTFTFTQAADIDRIVITPGIQNGQLSMNALATPAKVILMFDDGTLATFTVGQVTASGANRQVFRFSSVHTSKVTMIIQDVYAPEFASGNTGTSGEVAISEVSFLQTPDGNPIGQGTLVQSPGSAITTAIPSGVSSVIPGAVPGLNPGSITNDVTNKVAPGVPGAVTNGVTSEVEGAVRSAAASAPATSSATASPSTAP